MRTMILPLLALSLTSCQSDTLEPVPFESSLRDDHVSADGWSAEKLEEARLFAESIGSSAVVAIHDGELICEWGVTDKRISGHSVRKSLLSAMYGIAEQRSLVDVQATLADLGIDDDPPLTDGERQARIVDLLTSRSGIYHPSVKDDSGDVLPARDSHPPDTVFYYNNWSFNTLGGILEELTGASLGELFSKWIAEPTHMQDFRVEDVRYIEGDESRFDAWRFWVSARDLARFGELFLNRGRVGDIVVVPEAWIDESTAPRSHIGKRGYGYMWWTNEDGSYYASGTGGQKVLVAPDRQLVVVNRVDTGDGASRAWWWNYGTRVKNSQFRELVEKIMEAAPSP